MGKIFLTIITVISILFLSTDIYKAEAKGFKFKSYKSYKSYKQPQKKSTLDHSFNKVKKSKNQTPIFQKQWFKWFIGGMIFGALLSFLMGYGFHLGMPGLLEIIIIGLLVYLIYKYFKTKKEEYSYHEMR